MSPSDVPRTLGGYVLDRKLGQGGMGAVYRATHPQMPGRAFAVKVLASQGRASENMLARFRREVDAIVAASTHPNVVRVVAGSVEGARPYLVMDLVEGSSLASLAEGEPLEPRRAAEIVRQLASAVEHFHGLGIVHRDLKPENVLVEPDGTARVVDFGLAKIVGDTERLTKTGTMLGTPAFAAPEQLSGQGHDAGPPADVYGLGGILWFALVGRPPFETATVSELMTAVLVTPPEPPSRVRRGVPWDLDAIALHALAKEPRDRYASAAALRGDLEAFLAGRSILARRASSGERIRESVRRHPLTAVGGAVSLLAVAIAASVVTGQRVTRTRLVEGHMRRALDPASSGDVVAEELAVLEPLGLDPGETAKVRARLVVALEGEAAVRLKRGEAQTLEQIRRLSRAALDAPGAANLVGEVADAPLVLGDLLLEGDKDARDVARKLAAARLHQNAKDSAARDLRATEALARAGLPFRALGPGALGSPVPAEVRADLEAASALDGAPGARAAALLADLLVAARLPDAVAAVASARALAGRLPEKERPVVVALEEAIAPEATEAKLARLLARLDSPAPGLAPFELSRVFAWRGAPGAFEHPELALATTDAALERAIESALAREPAGAYAAVPPQDYPDGLGLDFIRAVKAVHFESTPAELDRARDAIEGALRREPRRIEALGHAARPELGGLAPSVFLLFVVRSNLGTMDLVWRAFSREGRLSARASADMARGQPGANYLDVRYFPEEEWETANGGEAGCLEIDRRLLADVASSRFVAAARSQPDGITAVELERAENAVRGLRRLEELEERDQGLGADERVRMALEALDGVEDFGRMGGPAYLEFRARLRLKVIPGPFGRALARLDLRRVLRLAHDQTITVPTPNLQGSDLGLFLIGSATPAQAIAGETRHAGLHRELYSLGVAWAHEFAIARAWATPLWSFLSPDDVQAIGFPQEAWPQVLVEAGRSIPPLLAAAMHRFAEQTLAGYAEDVIWKPHSRPLFARGLLTQDEVRRDFELTLDDERRLVRPYAFQRPGGR